MRGRGREIIQLGLPIADAPLEDENGGSQKSCLEIVMNISNEGENFPSMQQPDHIISSSLRYLSFWFI